MKTPKKLSEKIVATLLLSVSAVFLVSAVVIKSDAKETNVLGTKQSAESKTIHNSPTGKLPSAYPTSLTINNALSTPTPTDSAQKVSSPTAMPSPTQAPQSAPQTNEITVTINDSSSFKVSVPNNANQCDVLKKSLDEGKLQSLTMRYDDNLSTYGVYQINGVGRENQIWWTYKINGQIPSQGCSYIRANNNDSVVWKYVGN